MRDDRAHRTCVSVGAVLLCLGAPAGVPMVSETIAPVAPCGPVAPVGAVL